MSSPSTSDGTTTRRNVLIAIGVVALAAVAAAVWWFTSAEAATVDIGNALSGAATSSETPTGDAPADGATTTTDDTPAPTDPSGSDATTPAPDDSGSDTPAAGDAWTVTTNAVPYDFANAEGTFVGFRIEEELSSVGSTTAVARTPAVTGELTTDDTMLTAATFTADLTEVTSDRGQRNRAIQRALNTSENPEATFELTEPVDLGEIPPVGEAVEVEVTGGLTVNGTTVTDTFLLQGGRTAEDQLVVTGSFDVPLSDFGIDAPSAPIVVSIADTATVEFQLYLER